MSSNRDRIGIGNFGHFFFGAKIQKLESTLPNTTIFGAKIQMKHFPMIYNHCESLQASFELFNIPKLRMVR